MPADGGILFYFVSEEKGKSVAVEAGFRNWQANYQPAEQIDSRQALFVTLFQPASTGFIDCSQVQSFNQFLQGMYPGDEILH